MYYSRQLEKEFRQRKTHAGNRLRMDETHIKVKGQWKYFYRAVDPTVGAFRRNKITQLNFYSPPNLRVKTAQTDAKITRFQNQSNLTLELYPINFYFLIKLNYK